jgi:hypothetical protein
MASESKSGSVTLIGVLGHSSRNAPVDQRQLGRLLAHLCTGPDTPILLCTQITSSGGWFAKQFADARGIMCCVDPDPLAIAVESDVLIALLPAHPAEKLDTLTAAAVAVYEAKDLTQYWPLPRVSAREA